MCVKGWGGSEMGGIVENVNIKKRRKKQQLLIRSKKYIELLQKKWWQIGYSHIQEDGKNRFDKTQCSSFHSQSLIARHQN